MRRDTVHSIITSNRRENDHTEGLCNEFFEMLRMKRLYLYASPISIRILRNTYPNAKHQLKQLTVGEASLMEIDYMNTKVYLTVNVMPAGHCPGSIMFLFETDHVKVLCTGDFRIDNQEQFMNKYFKDVRQIDTIYLDTTFCKTEYTHFPSRKETLTGICNLIQNWLDTDKKNLIKLDMPAIYGSEFLFQGIFKKTGYKIHVNKERACASYHPSYKEICDFIKYLKPKCIIACVVPSDENEKDEMAQLLRGMRMKHLNVEENSQEFFIDTTKLLKINSGIRQKSSRSDEFLSSPPRKSKRIDSDVYLDS
ncbi:hypothetical protein Trydic_g18661 [Trypoxylus dichotomus]